MLVSRPTELGQLLRQRRQELGLSQAQLAERIGTSRQWVGKVEAGREGSELGLVLKALKALQLEVQVLPEGARPTAADSEAVDLAALLEAHRDD